VPARCVQNIYKTVCVHHFYTFLFLRICTYDLLKTVCILSSNSYAPLSHSFSAYRAFMCICWSWIPQRCFIESWTSSKSDYDFRLFSSARHCELAHVSTSYVSCETMHKNSLLYLLLRTSWNQGQHLGSLKAWPFFMSICGGHPPPRHLLLQVSLSCLLYIHRALILVLIRHAQSPILSIYAIW
jgi:hypothetical protein